MVRAFVALELSEEIKRRLSAAQQALRGCGARLTFVEPKNIHITAKFLGEVNESDVQTVVRALGEIHTAPFEVVCGRVTVNDPHRPRTVWCTIDDKGAAGAVVQRIEDALSPIGFPRERRRYTPHATIARVRSVSPSLLPAVQDLDGAEYGRCLVRGMVLKKSTLLPQGPVYEDLGVINW